MIDLSNMGLKWTHHACFAAMIWKHRIIYSLTALHKDFVVKMLKWMGFMRPIETWQHEVDWVISWAKKRAKKGASYDVSLQW